MQYVIAALVVVGALSMVNLAVMLILTRRVNELRRQRAGMRPPPGRGLLPVGTVVPDFTGTSVDGSSITRSSLADRSLVVFLAPGCQPCQDLLPILAARAESDFGGPDRVLAVLSANNDDEADEYLRKLSGVARVVVESEQRAVSEAFKAIGFPAAYVVGAGGRILAAGAGVTALDELPVGAGKSKNTVSTSVG